MSASFTIKLITKQSYHLWNDALHARELVRQTSYDWNRGTYVRWTVTTSWTVFEQCCADALDKKDIRNPFRENLDREIAKKGFAEINWAEGTWRSIKELQDLRHDYIHRRITQEELFPAVEKAEDAIKIVRNAVKDIYRISNKPIPTWIDDDSNEGWVTT